MDRDVDFYYLAEQLIPFLVTRQIYAGAGKVFQTQDGVHYCVSQRAQHIYQKISGTTTNDRSIINTRDEPHADREKYRRLHVIVGDSNMSEYTNFLKVGTACSVVLQMIEDNYINKDFTLRNPVKAIKDITYDTTCKRRLRLDNGREYSPIEIQLEYCEMAQKYIEQYPVSDEHKEAVQHVAIRARLPQYRPKQARSRDRIELGDQASSMIEASTSIRTGTSWNDPRRSSCSISSTTTSSAERAGSTTCWSARAPLRACFRRRRDRCKAKDRAAPGHARAHARRVHQAGSSRTPSSTTSTGRTSA